MHAMFSEHVVFQGKASFLTLYPPLIVSLVGAWIFFQSSAPIQWTGVMAFLVGVAFLIKQWVLIYKANLTLTNQRVLLKRGLFLNDIHEIFIDDIAFISARHGWMGRAFNYGDVRIQSRHGITINAVSINNQMNFISKLRALLRESRA